MTGEPSGTKSPTEQATSSDAVVPDGLADQSPYMDRMDGAAVPRPMTASAPCRATGSARSYDDDAGRGPSRTALRASRQPRRPTIAPMPTGRRLWAKRSR